MIHRRTAFWGLWALALGVGCVGWGRPAGAGTVSYHVSANTAGIAGTAGFLDFQLNPASSSSPQVAAVIASFVPDGGTLASTSTLSGNATGVLPGLLLLGNTTAFNEVYQGFTYGTTLSFDVTLTGPAIGPQPPGTTDGSTFSFTMDDGSGSPLSSGPGGASVTIDITPDGTVTALAYAPATAGGPTVSVVPEPSGWVLLGSGMGVVIGAGWRRGRRTSGSTTPDNP